MAQSTTNLGKIHVFPSETLYNQFKDIIADNDLALLKDDGGVHRRRPAGAERLC